MSNEQTADHDASEEARRRFLTEPVVRPRPAENEAAWEPTRWWQVLAPDGSIWCETSSESEARGFMRAGDTLCRLYQRTEEEWRVIPPEVSDQSP